MKVMNVINIYKNSKQSIDDIDCYNVLFAGKIIGYILHYLDNERLGYKYCWKSFVNDQENGWFLCKGAIADVIKQNAVIIASYVKV